MRISLFGRHARHAFGDTSHSVADVIARVGVDPKYAHKVGPQEYPTGTYPAWIRGQLVDNLDPAQTPPRRRPPRRRPDLGFALAMGGAQ